MTGKVYLVGAGPGRADLITIRARQVIDRGEVILYDQLAGEIVKTLPASAELIDCGKYAGRHTLKQEEIEKIMITRAKEGRIVVRLKGGDPFLFGRGGEELEALRSEGIDVELVPGVTSAIAVPGCAGIPVTHRDCASLLAIVTGHEDPLKEGGSVRWDLLAGMEGTIVILMGVGNLSSIVDSLLKWGKDPQTPVAIIERGLTEKQRVTTGALSTIVEIADLTGVRPPAVIVIGSVVRLYRGEMLCGATR
ncbi:MAG: uroporphyrinogen-III C-methyltransferase [Methanomicrobiales archaeon]|nr:uroporphyrinogen-III C-methyltransferase [Methanomicrobiales archaeon]